MNCNYIILRLSFFSPLKRTCPIRQGVLFPVGWVVWQTTRLVRWIVYYTTELVWWAEHLHSYN